MRFKSRRMYIQRNSPKISVLFDPTCLAFVRRMTMNELIIFARISQEQTTCDRQFWSNRAVRSHLHTMVTLQNCASGTCNEPPENNSKVMYRRFCGVETTRDLSALYVINDLTHYFRESLRYLNGAAKRNSNHPFSGVMLASGREKFLTLPSFRGAALWKLAPLHQSFFFRAIFGQRGKPYLHLQHASNYFKNIYINPISTVNKD